MQKCVIIVAGGEGKRFGSNLPKQFVPLAGKPVLLHTLEKIYLYSHDIKIIVVLPKEYIDFWQNICHDFNVNISHLVVEGGKERFFSVINGLNKSPDNSLIAIHDGVRPFVSLQTLNNCFDTAEKQGNAIPAVAVNDSIRLCNYNTNYALDRNQIKIVQTPQVFLADIIKKSYRQSFTQTFTDDASVVEATGEKINLVEGNIENIKITTPLDLVTGEYILKNIQL